ARSDSCVRGCIYSSIFSHDLDPGVTVMGAKRTRRRATAPPPGSSVASMRDFWASVEVMWPVAKEAISLRVDRNVLEWFRAQGPAYQSRMNAVLRSFMMQATGSARQQPGAPLPNFRKA